MRFITWNVGHQTGRKPLPEEAAAGIGRLSPDVVVLTEYVYCPTHEAFLNALAGQRISHRSCSAYVPNQNQVLIASRRPLTAGSVVCDVELSAATRPNWLHVRTGGFDVVGFRRPMFKGVPQGTTRYWDWFTERIAPLMAGAAVVLGDFNAARQARVLSRVRAQGWQLVSPDHGWSFRSKVGGEFAIDHALVSPALRSSSATYHREAGGYAFAGDKSGYSDHAVLCIDVER